MRRAQGGSDESSLAYEANTTVRPTDKHVTLLKLIAGGDLHRDRRVLDVLQIEIPSGDIWNSQHGRSRSGVVALDRRAIFTPSNELIQAYTAPAIGQFNSARRLGLSGIRILLLPPLRRLLARLGELGELLFLPLVAAIGEDAFEEDGGGFGVGVLRSPVLGEFALDRCLEDGSSISLQVGLHPLQGGDPGIEVGEKLFDLGDDAALLVQWSDWNRKRGSRSPV